MDEPEGFHGHMCPMYALGLRMGKKALDVLGRDREPGIKLVAVVEYKNCLADGIQYICGTTYGKNNLYYREYGKFAASFYDLASGKSVRIAVKGGILEKVLDFGLMGQAVKKLHAASREEEARTHFRRGREIVEEMDRKSDKELFETMSAPRFEPIPEPSLEHEKCQKCGEVVLKDFIKIKGKKKLCIPCSTS